MKKLLRKIGLSIIGVIFICLFTVVSALIFNGIGHITNKALGDAFEPSPVGFLDYLEFGVASILILFVIAMVFLAGYFMMLRFATRYREKKPKRNPQECPYDSEGRNCQHYNGATGYIDKDCEYCEWWNNGVRPSKFSKRNNEI